MLIPIVIESEGSSTVVTGSGRGSIGIGDRLADRHVRKPGDRHDLPRARLLGGDAVEGLGDVELRDAGVLDLAVRPAPRDRGSLAQGAVVDTAEREPADVRRRVEVRDERLQRVIRVVRGRGHGGEQGADERPEVGRELVRREARLAGTGVRVHDRELDLRLVGVEVEEELVDLVDHLLRARVGPVDLVDDEHDGQVRLERLTQHEARLGSGPSLASTSSSTPSTIVSPRSTSPPKSACPGVSMMFSLTSPTRTAVFFARIVIPFSRSRSIESMTRSLTSWFSRKEPACQSSASTSVVLPWSTCATIATLRRSSRVAVRFGPVTEPR